jgi:hypothetical protein
MSNHESTNPAQTGDGLGERLDQGVSKALQGLAHTAAWKALSEGADLSLARDILREVYLSVWAYHAHVFEAAATLIGRLPRDEPAAVGRLFRHLVQESTHGEMALAAFADLGGNEAAARAARMPPAAFAIASFWKGLAVMDDPLCYLGAMYLFVDAEDLRGRRAALNTARRLPPRPPAPRSPLRYGRRPRGSAAKHLCPAGLPPSDGRRCH